MELFARQDVNMKTRVFPVRACGTKFRTAQELSMFVSVGDVCITSLDEGFNIARVYQA